MRLVKLDRGFYSGEIIDELERYYWHSKFYIVEKYSNIYYGNLKNNKEFSGNFAERCS